MLSCSHPAPLPAWPHVKVTGLSHQSASHSPVRADANVMHVELDSLGLLLVFEMVISQQVVELIYHWRGGVSPFWEAGHLASEKVKIKEGGARDSDVTNNAANLGPFIHMSTGQTLASPGPDFWCRAKAHMQQRWRTR